MAPLGAWAAAAVVAACAPRPEAPPREEPVVWIRPAVPTPSARQWKTLLSEMYPHAPRYPAAQFADACALCLREKRVLVLPDAAQIPVECWGPLTRFLATGGRALLLGRDPFARRVFGSDGTSLTEEQWLDRIFDSAQGLPDFSDVQLWRHMNESGVMRGSVSPVRPSETPWPAVEVEVLDFREWDTLAAEAPADGWPAGANTLVFFARGDDRTTRLAVELTAANGERWYAVVPVGAEWGRVALREEHFRPVAPGAIPEAPFLRLADVRRVEIGLSMARAPQEPGNHRFGLSDVRAASDPRPREAACGWPDLEMISPPELRYETFAAAVQPLGGTAWDVGGAWVHSPMPSPRGWGGARAGRVRWVPLAEALSQAGDLRGWAASVWWRAAAGEPASGWGWIGMDATPACAAALRDLVGRVVERLSAELFLGGGGCDRFAFFPGERVSVLARWAGAPRRSHRVRVVAELCTPRGERVRHVASEVFTIRAPSACGDLTLDLGPCPPWAERANDYVVRVVLEEADVPARVWDTLEQPIKVLARESDTAQAPRLSCTGPRFARGRAPTFLAGVDYEGAGSLFGARQERPHFLDPGVFDPGRLRRDLDFLEKIGANVLAISYLRPEQAAQLQYVVEECRRRDMWLCVYLPGLSPLDFDPAGARALMAAARLGAEPRVFALELAREPSWGFRVERARWDAAWRDWLQEQYGTLERAEEILGPLWREEGALVGPPDEALEARGERARAIAAYRRFLHDHASRRFGAIARFLRELGVRSLLTARFTVPPAPLAALPLDPATGALHLDFLMLAARGLAGPEEQFQEAGFFAAYARGASGGKPVVWIAPGVPVGPAPRAPDFQNQARVCERMLDLAWRSGAGGCFIGTWPISAPPGLAWETSLAHPDGTARPAAEVFRHAARRLRSAARGAVAWKGREVSLWADPQGLAGLWEAWKVVYQKEMADDAVSEVRPRGFGQPTDRMPLDTVGGGEVPGPAPLECANAEWGRVVGGEQEVQRGAGEPLRLGLSERVELELVNTGPATWVASVPSRPRAVWIRAEPPDASRPVLLAVPETPMGGRARATWVASKPGIWQLQAYLEGFGVFGEALRVEVAAPRPDSASQAGIPPVSGN